MEKLFLIFGRILSVMFIVCAIIIAFKFFLAEGVMYKLFGMVMLFLAYAWLKTFKED